MIEPAQNTDDMPTQGNGRSTGEPYKFLDYYLEKDEAKFAGRDRDIRDVIAGITTSRTFVLYGRSGLGKTSLLLAGLFPELRRRDYLPIYVRTLDSPVADLAQAVATASEGDSETGDGGLEATLESLSSKKPVVLVLDQFEEFFIRFRKRPNDRAEFIDCIVSLLGNSRLGVHVVFSLREDHLAALDDFQRAIPKLFSNAFRLLPLTAFGARQAIIQPLIAAGVHYDRRLVTGLLDLLEDDNFDPPLLQIACVEVYRAAKARGSGRPHLGLEDIKAVGDLKAIFRKYLDSAVDGIEEHHDLLVRVMLEALITQERTKQAVKLEFFLDLDIRADKDEVGEVLAQLVTSRLVRRERRGKDIWYELIHERMVNIVLRWLRRDPEFFAYKQATDLLASLARGYGWRDECKSLMAKGQVDNVVGPFRERLRLSEIQQEFMVASCVYQQSDHLEHWAGELGRDASGAIVLRMLRNDDKQARLGAATAAARIGEHGGNIADACLERGLTDEIEEIRRAAGRALRSIGGPDQLNSLRKAIDDRQTREAALELLADLQ